LEILILALWLIRSSGSIAQSTYYWQLKEYRFDRMREFLIQQQGHQIFLTFYHVILLVLLLAYLLIIVVFKIDGYFAKFFPLLVGTLFLAESLKYIHQVFIRRFRRPVLTPKAILIVIISFLTEFALFYIYYYFSSYQLSLVHLALVLSLLSFVDQDINALVIMMMNFVGKYVKKRIYNKALKKRLKLKGLQVVGITGSYGKTSVKEYIHHIIQEKFETLKTDKNTNTEMGIANTILKKLHKKHEVFVCEMGAYSSGEVKQCCYMAHPKIAVFSGLNEQHLALFGSLDNTFKAKWELISSLPSNGVSVFNGDSLELRSRLKRHHAESVVCSTFRSAAMSRSRPNGKGDAVADKIHIDAQGLSFCYKDQLFKSSLIGEFQVINLLMSIVVAGKLGMNLKDIAQRVKTIKAPEKTMKITEFKRGLIIDDSYNVNPDGFEAALKHLDLFPEHKKIVFFPGILELGEETFKIHHSLGRHIAKHVDYAFFTDIVFAEILSRGALENGLTRERIFIDDDQEALKSSLKSLFKKHQNEKFVVLFESRGAEKIMNYLK